MNEILISISSGIGGAIIGYLLKVFIDHRLQLARIDAEKNADLEKSEQLKHIDDKYIAAQLFLLPLAEALEGVSNRVNVALAKNWFGKGYTRVYTYVTFLYQLCVLCFWLDAPTRDVRFVKVLDDEHEEKIRNAITKISDWKLFDQKIIAEKMKLSETNGLTPVSYGEFQEMQDILLDGERESVSRKFLKLLDNGLSEAELKEFENAFKDFKEIAIKISLPHLQCRNPKKR